MLILTKARMCKYKFGVTVSSGVVKYLNNVLPRSGVYFLFWGTRICKGVVYEVMVLSFQFYQ